MRFAVSVVAFLLLSTQSCATEDHIAVPNNYSQFTGATSASFTSGVYMPTNPSTVHFEGEHYRRTFVAYQGETKSLWLSGDGEGCDPHIVFYDWDEQQWYGPFKVAKTPIQGDDHSGGCLFIDEYDRLHVFYGSHGTPDRPQYWTRSTRSLDTSEPFTGIDDFEEPKSFGTAVTYPQVVGIVDDKLVLFLRGENLDPIRSHSQRVSWWESANHAGTWANASFLKVWEFIDSGDAGVATAYLNYTPVTDSNGNIHVAWFWYEADGDGIWHEDCYNVNYARYNAAAGHWEQADGTAYVDDDGDPVPITLTTAEVVAVKASYDEGGSGCRAENLDVDETGRPYVSNNYNLHVWEGTEWVQRTPPALIRAIEVISSELMYIYTYEEGGGELCRYQSTDRGAQFTDRLVLGQWSTTDEQITQWPADFALAKGIGSIPTVAAFTRYTHTNPIPPEDEGRWQVWRYDVGQVWAASLGFPYVSSVSLVKGDSRVLALGAGTD